MANVSYADIYIPYLRNFIPDLNHDIEITVQQIIKQTRWDDPISGLDWNNLGVMALLESEQAQDSTMRSVYLDMAANAFQAGEHEHPLCSTHLALLEGLIGESSAAIDRAYQTALNVVAIPEHQNFQIPLGLLYYPLSWSNWPQGSSSLPQFFTFENGFEQALRLSAEVVWRSHLVFYNKTGLRLLQFASQILPDSSSVHLRLGIASLSNQLPEGLVSLCRARELCPKSMDITQALYLACLDQAKGLAAQSWKSLGHAQYQQERQNLTGVWTEITDPKLFTYTIFDQDIVMAVEPSFKSIVTSVLVAEGDWFEKEIEWWRNWIQPGMTVIDVGANVGVYTYSAAKRVGSSGRVLAVEPFSNCVACLEETRQRNQLDWVTVIAGAASHQTGTAYLKTHLASELNELFTADQPIVNSENNVEQVNCFTLDDLCVQEKLSNVDLLKIDAEGHEPSVLAGSEVILTQFRPIILFENIAGSQGQNDQVSQFLRQKGYKILRYQPFLQTLVPVEFVEDSVKQLNLIAWPQERNIPNLVA